MRSDWQRARAETAELRRELDEDPRRNRTAECGIEERGGNRKRRSAATQEAHRTSRRTAWRKMSDRNQEEDRKKSEHAAGLEEEYQLLSGKVDDQYQTKVESASKYRLRLSGIVLMNLVSNQGSVDNIDLPTLAYAKTGGRFGGELRGDFATVGDRIRGFRAERGRREDEGGSAT